MQNSERRRFNLGIKWENPWHPSWLPASLRDTLSNRYHSRDFNFARSEYLRTRVLFVGMAFTLLAPLWILVDYLLLPLELVAEVALGRFALMLVLFGVLYSAWKNENHLNRMRNTLAALLLAPAVFYAALVLTHGGQMSSLVGYSFIPLLVVAFLSVFPLTIIESLGIGLLVLLVQLLALSITGQMKTAYGWQDLWLLVTILGISLWANHSQVSTLMRLYRQASMDSLTGLLNRGILLQQLNELCRQRDAQIEEGEEPSPICLLMFDLDRFKKINDTYGHSVGDQVLQVFAQILRSELRKNDLIARYGGEEFMAALPGTGKADARNIAERIRLQCEKSTVIAHDGEQVTFTTSIGITQVRDNESLDAALLRVDNRLYAAKNQGRNRYIDADLS
ncbi:GGDEF domain-containing protein [Marinospirillum alkaliphilum]|uniref:diguanylate cyclase n=1 Tax=Marinospirillum alkaliphilum DSM 21637 TaxID=1122209 RepID=A0A1K1YND5_9GAMM|nr:GGDEF domain-containing protein [Marinospirillum alkaliphilum]SFX63506.1 diguanylate cyclase (GGDEF) domain-containing protein [Marinospirillum alkaliphilum DSM 21637]